jgi:hypothetical protein
MGVADMGLATQGTSLPPQCAPKLECSYSSTFVFKLLAKWIHMQYSTIGTSDDI